LRRTKHPPAADKAARRSSSRRLIPEWLSGYRRDWLGRDVVAGVIVWGVVVPQAIAYAQIAGLPPEAGLVAAPGAMIGYAILGTSRTLIVSATTATSALSAAAIGPLADGNVARFAALSAGLALVSAAVLVGAGLLRLGGVMDLVSKPVMTGFLFGLGLTVMVGQAPKLFGIDGGEGNFFEMLGALFENLGDTVGWTLGVGIASIALLIGLKRLAPKIPATLFVLALAIVVSALLDLASRGVEVVGDLPSALPNPSWPDITWSDMAKLLPAAFGVMIVCAEAIGVSRSIASSGGYSVDTNRDLVALGGANLLAGLSQGFVQSGGASQTMAAEEAGGRTQLVSIVAAGLILLTGAFLAPLFADLPQATLGAIVVVAIAGFLRVDELRRFAALRSSAVGIALLALIGVLVLGVLPGLIVAAGLSLAVVIKRISRPSVGVLARDPATGAWGRSDRHPEWVRQDGFVVARVDGPLFYANASSVKERLLVFARKTKPRPGVLVLDLSGSPDLDVETLDTLGELAQALSKIDIELRLASVRAPAQRLLHRAGITANVEPTLDAAIYERPSRSGDSQP
jgi:SulP family sulfate permease